MVLPDQPITLSVEQIKELNEKMSDMRHDVNNHLSLLMAGIEVVRVKPEMAERMFIKMNEQPAKISRAIGKFSEAFDQALGIVRPR